MTHLALTTGVLVLTYLICLAVVGLALTVTGHPGSRQQAFGIESGLARWIFLAAGVLLLGEAILKVVRGTMDPDRVTGSRMVVFVSMLPVLWGPNGPSWHIVGLAVVWLVLVLLPLKRRASRR
jgi:hypothetical protein